MSCRYSNSLVIKKIKIFLKLKAILTCQDGKDFFFFITFCVRVQGNELEYNLVWSHAAGV